MQAGREGEVAEMMQNLKGHFTCAITANTQKYRTSSFIAGTLLSGFSQAKENIVFFQIYLCKIPRSHFHGKKNIPKANATLGISEPKLDQLTKISISELQHRKD